MLYVKYTTRHSAIGETYTEYSHLKMTETYIIIIIVLWSVRRRPLKATCLENSRTLVIISYRKESPPWFSKCRRSMPSLRSALMLAITVLSLVLGPLNELHFQGINYLLWGINSCKHNYTNGFQYKNIFWSLKPKGILESEIRFNCCTTGRGIKPLFCFFLCLVWQFAGFLFKSFLLRDHV